MTEPVTLPLAGTEPKKGKIPVTTAGAVLAMLRRHYLPDETQPAGVFAAEIQAPGPVQRRADLIWLGCTAAAGNWLVGHEIKVSRADVLTELADLTKTDPWQRYCNQWWLVVPHTSLIQGLELPESWGVMLPPSGRRTRSMTIHRRAPQLDPVDQSPALRKLAARQLWELRDATYQADRARKAEERLRLEVEQQEITGTSRRGNPTAEMVTRIVKELGGSWDGEHIGGWPGAKLSIADVVTALQDLSQTRGEQEKARKVLTQLRSSLEFTQREITNLLANTRGTAR